MSRRVCARYLATYLQKSSAEESGAVAESVRKKLKTGREKIDRTQSQQNVAEDSGNTLTESNDRLYVELVSVLGLSQFAV